ncbi:MAG: glycosyltransferase family 9 protein [Armatimonadota bacterium]
MQASIPEPTSSQPTLQEKSSGSPSRILIVKLSAIGDVLMATPVAKALRLAFPASYIAWVVEKKAAEIVTGNPYLNEVIVWERTKGEDALSKAMSFVQGLCMLRRTLKARSFDICLDLQGLLRSAIVCWISGAKRRIGFADGGEYSTLFYTEKFRQEPDQNNHCPSPQQRNLDLLKTLGIQSTDIAMYMPIGEEDRIFASRFFEKEEIMDTPAVALCPATTWANKHWTVEGWARVADLLLEKYATRPIILGSKADLELTREIVNKCQARPVVATGQTTLKQAGAIIEKCVAVVGVDTGLLHMAVALDKPAVGLFGASAWRCFPRKHNFIWVAKEFSCSPCFRHPTCKNFDCMRAITPEDVEEAIRHWLQSYTG